MLIKMVFTFHLIYIKLIWIDDEIHVTEYSHVTLVRHHLQNGGPFYNYIIVYGIYTCDKEQSYLWYLYR